MYLIERNMDMSKELNKTYNPKDIEDRLYQKWESNGYFRATVDRSKKPFTNKIFGYSFVNDVKRVYLVELKTKCDNKDYVEKAIICESLLLLKLKQKSISSKYIGNATNISI